MISFVIPAHNEAALIGRTLSAVRESTRHLSEPSEVIVVDDASTDGTGEIARGHGARVVPVHFRRIAATRNAGAREAVGELLFFVDADTVVPARALRAAVRALRGGGVGGGAGGPVRRAGPAVRRDPGTGRIAGAPPAAQDGPGVLPVLHPAGVPRGGRVRRGAGLVGGGGIRQPA